MSIIKTNLFLDFDLTIVDSLQAVCDVYNLKYSYHPNFNTAYWYNCDRYDLKDICPLETDIHSLFSDKSFFENLQFINPNTKEVIEKLCDKYNVSICSIGVPLNIHYKALWIAENLPCLKNSIFIMTNPSQDIVMDKSSINMANGIIVDDVASNLDTSNAELKICFGDIFNWNENWKGERCFNWTDVYNGLM
jgi:5'(3')-deoxyribonucleotidase